MPIFNLASVHCAIIKTVRAQKNARNHSCAFYSLRRTYSGACFVTETGSFFYQEEKMEVPVLFQPDSVAERVRNNVALCDRCRNYKTMNCPCGRFNRIDPVLREQLTGLHDCCDFEYFWTGQQEFCF